MLQEGHQDNPRLIEKQSFRLFAEVEFSWDKITLRK